MSRRGVALHTSLIKTSNLTSYNNKINVNIDNSMNVTGNITVSNNLNILGTDEPLPNDNVTYTTTTYTIDNITNDRYTQSSTELKDIVKNLYIGNTYIFNQSANNFNEQIIISRKKIEYHKSTSQQRIRVPYTTGVTYSIDNSNYSIAETNANRKYVKFTPTERGVYYIVNRDITPTMKAITINVLDNVYNYGAYITNSGLSLKKNLNVGGNMNVKDGMLYIVNDKQYSHNRMVGVGTTIPKIGFDFTNLPNYRDAVLLPKTIGVGTSEGIEGMVRYNYEQDLFEGYRDEDWTILGGCKDSDKDTHGTAAIDGRPNELEFTSEGTKRLTIVDNDITAIGIATTLPTATLEINGNLNVKPDGSNSGVILGNDTTVTDRYFKVELTNNTSNTSIDYKSNNGGKTLDINGNVIKTSVDETLNAEDYSIAITGTNIETISGVDTTTMESSLNNTTTGTFHKTCEHSAIETYQHYYNLSIHGDSTETYLFNYNSNVSGNRVYDKHKIRTLYIGNNTNNTHNIHHNINITSDLIQTITGNRNLTVVGVGTETYNSDYTDSMAGNKIYTIQNNTSVDIKTNYNINIMGNLIETYNNFNKTISLYHKYNINGTYSKISNNNTISYKNNLNLNNTGFFTQKIHINKNNNIIGNLTETFKKSSLLHTNTDKTRNIHGDYKYNLNANYFYNVTGNKDIKIHNNLVSTVNADMLVSYRGTTQNNIFYNMNVSQSCTYNVNKISNFILYNTFTKYIYDNTTELYNKSKNNHLLLSGHPLSGPNTISITEENTDSFKTNYIKIVESSVYDTQITVNPDYYVFPGEDATDTLGGTVNIDNWYILKSGSATNSWIIINSYYAASYDHSSYSGNNDGDQYAILGPTDIGNYAIILWSAWTDTYNSDQTQVPDNDFKFKFILGPQKHQLEYNLTTHYIKIFCIGATNAAITLLKLNSNTFEATQTHPYISHVGTTDRRYNSADSDPTNYPNSNEFNRFIFIHIDGSDITTNGLLTSAKYYIYNSEEDKYLKNNSNTSVTFDNPGSLDSNYEWTIETVNTGDTLQNSDIYYIYNNNKYIQIQNDNSTVILANKDSSNVRQKFTFYYKKPHRANVNASSLTYNSESRISYITKDYKYIYINGNTSSWVSAELNGSSKHIIKTTGTPDPFLFIYHDTFDIPGSGTSVGLFKIYDPENQRYLFNNYDYNWIIESVSEDSGTHVGAKHIIKLHAATVSQWIYNNSNVLDFASITATIPNTSKFTFTNTSTGISGGTLTKKAYKLSNKFIKGTETFSITGNTTETYKSDFNSNITTDSTNTFKHLYNINIYKDSTARFNKYKNLKISGHLTETLLKSHNNYIKQTLTEQYKSNNTIYISGNLTTNINEASGNFTNYTYGSTKYNLNANSTETYRATFDTKCAHNTKTLSGNLVETLHKNQTKQVTGNTTILNNCSKTQDVVSNLNKIVGLHNTINILNNSNIVISGNRNITLTRNASTVISGNKTIRQKAAHTSIVTGNNTENYHGNNIIKMNKEVTEVISGDRSLTVSGDTVTTYTSSRTILLDNNLKETITGKLNYNISGEMAFNVNSDFTISCAKTIELATNTTGGYVHITNTNNGALVSENRALVVNGGVNNQRDMFIGGNITVAGNLNVLDNYGRTSLYTEVVQIHDPLMTIGANQIADTNHSGLLSRSYLDTTQKFSGIVRDSSNTYALLNNINTATNDNTEYSNTDLTNTFSNSLVDKHSSIFANKITSLEPNINTNGELYVAKNIFVGIDNSLPSGVNNSFTINIGSNINAQQDTFTIKSNKDINYNITNSQNINITSANNYNINVLNNKTTHIHNNLIETIIAAQTKTTTNTSTEKYNNYNINTTGNVTQLIKKNNTRNIELQNRLLYHNINTIGVGTFKIHYDYNINTYQNTIVDYHSTFRFNSNNLTNIIYNDNTSYVGGNHLIKNHGSFKFNVSGTYDKYVKLDDGENYRNTNRNIHGNLTETITGNLQYNINGTLSSLTTGQKTEVYGNNRAITISGHLQNNINGNRATIVHGYLQRTINNNSTELFKKAKNITVSENINTVVTGNQNITIHKNSNETFKSHLTQVVHGNATQTYANKTYFDVTGNSHETYYGYNSNITQKLERTIKYRYFQDITGNNDITINKDNTITRQKYHLRQLHNNSQETFGNTYKIHYNNTAVYRYNTNNTVNIKNHLTQHNNKTYEQHTVGISTSTFRTKHNINIKDNLIETYHSDINKYVKSDNYIGTLNNLSETTKINKTKTVGGNESLSNNSAKNFTIDDEITKYYNSDVLVKQHNDYEQEFEKYYQANTFDNTTMVYNNNHYVSVKGDMVVTCNGTRLITHHTGTTNTTNKDTLNYNKSLTRKISIDSNKNVHTNRDLFIKVNLNTNVMGITNIRCNNNSFIQTHSNNIKNIYKYVNTSVYETVNQNFNKNHTITIAKNNTALVSGNLTSTIYGNSTETIRGSSFITKGVDNNTTFTTTIKGLSNVKITSTNYRKIVDASVETYQDTFRLTTGGNCHSNITGTYNVNVRNTSTELFKKTVDVSTQGAYTGNYNNLYTRYIEKTSVENYKKCISITNNDNTKYAGGKYHLRTKDTASIVNNINLTTLGGLNLTADANINKNNNINFTTRTGILSRVCYKPQIIDTSTIGTSNISEFANTTAHYDLTPKTVNIIYIDANAALTTLINNNKDIFIRINLPDGTYNGQIIKILLHPQFESTFSTLSTRLAAGLKTNVVIRINNFCDTNDNEYVTVDLLLNRGGMALSLIYIDNNMTDNTDGYWMFMNNSFSYA